MKTNKLDEILMQFNEEMINSAVNDFGTEHHEDGYKPIVAKAKQAIIELIEGEIIGEDEATEFCHDDRELDERYARNFVRYIQRQKLQK